MNNENIRPMSMSEHQELLKLSKLIEKNNEEFDERFGSLWSGMKIVGGEDQQKERWGVVRKENIKDFLSKSHLSLLNNILEYMEGEKVEPIFTEKGMQQAIKRIINGKSHPNPAFNDGIITGFNSALQLIEDYITEALTK